MTIRITAKKIGTTDRTTEAEMKPHIKAYSKAKPERQAEMRTDFMTGYIAGKCKVSMTEADRILSNGKGAKCESEEHSLAIMGATTKFLYWFKPSKPAAPTSHARISRAHRDAAKAYLQMFDSVTEAIAALKAVAQ